MTHPLDVTLKRVGLPAFAVLMSLFLGACVSVSVPLPVPVPVPVQNQNLCESQASLTNPGIGATGGIGGTGAPRASLDPGGIGGTGILAGKPVFGEGGIGGTGIVGVITGFASICVNGFEVQYDATTPVWDNGQPATTRQLAVGQVVSLTASGTGAQSKARSIAVIHALVGPLAAVNQNTGKLQVLGQAATALQTGDLAGLRPGDWVRVSGHRLANGEIMASKVQPIAAPPGAAAQVRGPVHSLSGSTVKVGDTTLQLGAVALPAGLQLGQELWATGQWNGKVLLAQQVVVEPTRTGLGRIDQVVLEGYIHRLGPREISLGFEPLHLTDRVQIVGGTATDLAVNSRVQVSGRVGADQRITVERVEFSSPSAGDGSTSKNRGSSVRGGSNSGKGSGNSGSGSSGSGSSGSGSSGSGSSGSGSSGSGSSGSGSSGSGSSGSGSSGSGSGK
jgi:hypothetical protein